MLSNLNLHPAGEGKGHRTLPMHRDLLDQMPPVVCTEFGDAVWQGFDVIGEARKSWAHIKILRNPEHSDLPKSA